MDTSETYIKMADCPEIQGLRETKTGDYIARPDGSVYVYVEGGEFHIDSTWLPTQSQSQQMAGDFFEKELGIKLNTHQLTATIFVSFRHWFGEQYHDESYTCVPTNVFDTGEQLWLAFYKQEVHNKVWLNNKWEEQ